MPKKGERENLIGQRFGRLVVIGLDENLTQLRGRGYWVCKCDCGKICSVKACYLKNGMQKSCGCYKKEIVIRQHEEGRKTNRYVDYGDYMEGFDNNENSFLFDKEDFSIISKYYWSIDIHGYVIRSEGNHHIKMHAELLNPPKGYVTDHINHNRSDNRRSNLRIATSQQNAWNRRDGWPSKTGVKGVHYKTSGKFEVVINGRYLGSFSTLDEAISIRNQAEEKIHQDFRYDKHKDKGPPYYNNK